MPSRKIGCFRQGPPPPWYLVLPVFFITGKGLSKTSFLLSYMGWIHMIENWENSMSQIFVALHDLYQLIQTPSRTSIVFRENNYGRPWFFDGFQEFWSDCFSSPELIVSEGANPSPTQSFVEVISEIIAGVFASKTQENIISTCLRDGRSRRRRRGSVGACGSHCGFLSQKYKDSLEGLISLQDGEQLRRLCNPNQEVERKVSVSRVIQYWIKVAGRHSLSRAFQSHHYGSVFYFIFSLRT